MPSLITGKTRAEHLKARKKKQSQKSQKSNTSQAPFSIIESAKMLKEKKKKREELLSDTFK